MNHAQVMRYQAQPLPNFLAIGHIEVGQALPERERPCVRLIWDIEIIEQSVCSQNVC